jgi:pimeloyl-ACP methyl ester carboxylesterase
MAATASPRSAKVRANGIDIHFLEWGSGNGLPIVFLHGLRGHARSWDDVSAALAGQYRVLALDQRGRGETDWAPDGDYTTEAFAADLKAFCDVLRLERFVLVGHSMGGRNGIMFTANNPERVAGFVVADVGPDILPEGAARIRQELLAAPERFDSLEAAVAQTVAENPLATEEVLRRRVQYQTKPMPGGGITWRYDTVIREQVRSNSRPKPPDFWALWKTVTCPTLIVRGSETDILSRESAERMKASIPRAKIVEIPRAAHMVFEDNPRDFIVAVRDWLRAELTAKAD